jgi:hypothetical protein
VSEREPGRAEVSSVECERCVKCEMTRDGDVGEELCVFVDVCVGCSEACVCVCVALSVCVCVGCVLCVVVAAWVVWWW